jgi:hypothetical protein
MACCLVLYKNNIYPNPVNHTPPLHLPPVEHSHHGTHFVTATPISHCKGIMVDEGKGMRSSTRHSVFALSTKMAGISR